MENIKSIEEIILIYTSAWNGTEREAIREKIDQCWSAEGTFAGKVKLEITICDIKWGGRRTLPFVFTEHGVLMLSSVLNSAKAIQVNIQIMRIFTRFRKHILDHGELRVQIEEIRQQTHNNSQNIELVFQYLDELVEKKDEPKPRKRIGYKSDDL